MWRDVSNEYLEAVVENNWGRNHKWLTTLESVDSGQYIDGVCTEDSDHAHVNVVEPSCERHYSIKYEAQLNEIIGG